MSMASSLGQLRLPGIQHRHRQTGHVLNLHVPGAAPVALEHQIIGISEGGSLHKLQQGFTRVLLPLVGLSREHHGNRLTVGGELLGSLLGPLHQLGETSFRLMDGPGLQDPLSHQL